MSDNFSSFTSGLNSPAASQATVVPHDTNELSPIPRALKILTSGNIVIVAKDTSEAITYPVVAGEVLSIRARIVKAINTTATAAAWW